MRRRNILIAVGALVVLGLVGIGAARLLAPKPTGATLVAAKAGTCDDTFRVLKLPPSEVAAARPVCLLQSLTLSGELHGSVGQAYPVQTDGPAATAMCSTPRRWDALPAAVLAFTVGNKAYRLRIAAPGWSEHEPVTLRSLQGQVDLASITDPNVNWNQATGAVVVSADGVSGTIDADLVRDVAGARPVHIAGNWACGVPFTVAADPSVPCSNFYVLNQLQPADVARMKASACLPQDLSFSGAISAHVDHAINDAAYPTGPGHNADNLCGTDGETYNASFKFSLGNETFLLTLYTNNYPSVGPGQYSVRGDIYSANAFIWLGSADPTRNGRFTSDENTSWFASGGSFTIANDMKSGTIDETFNGLYSHHESTVHITGSWRCA